MVCSGRGYPSHWIGIEDPGPRAAGSPHTPQQGSQRAPVVALTPPPAGRRRARPGRLAVLLAVMGPGLVVMLADTDAGSIVTAAQSGAAWGYDLLWLQVALVPILFVVQELTVRLGTVTGQGHGELIRRYFGKRWAWFSVGTLALAGVGALCTEFVGVAGAGEVFGVPPYLSVGTAVAGLAIIAARGGYRRVELVAGAVGSLEFLYVVVAWHAHPSPSLFLSDLQQLPWSHGPYLYLIAANIGAVIMPWMIFYQQSAVVEKGLTAKDLPAARIDTAVGAVLTQVIMAAVLVSTAATLHTGGSAAGSALGTVPEIAGALTPLLGPTYGTALFALGMLGASLVAALVVSLAVAWGLGEVAGYRHSLAHSAGEAPWFYGIYLVAIVGSAAVVLSGVNLVRLSIGVQVMNAMLLPVVLGFLFLLARRALPAEHRLRGVPALTVAAVLLLTTAFGVVSAGLAL